MHLTAETRLNAILDGTGAGTWEYNLDTGEIIFNERWATMRGAYASQGRRLALHPHPRDPVQQ